MKKKEEIYKIIADDKERGFISFGPYIGVYRVDPNFTKKLLELGKKGTDFRERLAGKIKKELEIDLKKHPWVREYMSHYVLMWLEGYAKYGHDVNHMKNKDFGFRVQNIWMNFMKKGEYNPIHTHDNCHLSYVLYVKIPKVISDTDHKYSRTKGTQGSTNFFYGEHHWSHISARRVQPIENRLLIFPSTLRHSVDEFTHNVERITAAGNVEFINFDEKYDVP